MAVCSMPIGCGCDYLIQDNNGRYASELAHGFAWSSAFKKAVIQMVDRPIPNCLEVSANSTSSRSIKISNGNNNHTVLIDRLLRGRGRPVNDAIRGPFQRITQIVFSVFIADGF